MPKRKVKGLRANTKKGIRGPRVKVKRKVWKDPSSGVGGAIVQMDAMQGLKLWGLAGARRAGAEAAAAIMDGYMFDVFAEGQNEWPKLSPAWAASKENRGASDAIMEEYGDMLHIIDEGKLANIDVLNPTVGGLIYQWPDDEPHPNTKGLSYADLAAIHESGKYTKKKRKIVTSKAGGTFDVRADKPRPWLSAAISRGFIEAEGFFLAAFAEVVAMHTTAIKETDLQRAIQSVKF